LLPTPLLPEEDDEADEDEAADSSDEALRAQTFQTDLCHLVEKLQAATGTEPLPSWVKQYQVDGEFELRERIRDAGQKVEEARAALTDAQTELDGLESRKRLVTGTGRPLELEVRKVFEALGCVVEEPEPGRDDWRLVFPGGEAAVVEVKGVGASAAEKDAAQLEKWVANHLEERGVLPKGILIANAWRETDLAERTEPSFPDQMIPYSKARGHCLVTGLQLLGILQDVEADPSRRDHWCKKLLQTKGKLVGVDDWTKILTPAPAVEGTTG
jgi:hypothetical protein